MTTVSPKSRLSRLGENFSTAKRTAFSQGRQLGNLPVVELGKRDGFRVPVKFLVLVVFNHDDLLERLIYHSIRRTHHRLGAALFVGDFFHPVHNLAVELFLGGDMSHCGRRRSAMPVFLVRRKPNHVAWLDFLDRSSPMLRPGRNRL